MACLKMWASSCDECATGCGCRCAELALTAHLERSPRFGTMQPESQQIVNSTSSSDSEDTDDSSDSNETNSSSGTGSSDSDSNVELEENIDMYSRYFGRQVPGEFM